LTGELVRHEYPPIPPRQNHNDKSRLVPDTEKRCKNIFSGVRGQQPTPPTMNRIPIVWWSAKIKDN